MPTRLPVTLAIALVATLGATGCARQQPVYEAGPPVAAPSLAVLRTAAGDTVGGTGPVTVMFDRPVAQALDGTMPDTGLLTLEPAVTGRARWRDPVTLVFVPDAPLDAGRRYAVTVAPGLRGADGTTMARPHRFTVHVRDARLLGAFPITSYDAERSGTNLVAPADVRLRLVYSRPVSAARVAAAGHLVLHASCDAAEGRVALRGVSSRPLRADDPRELRWTARWYRGDSVPGEFALVEVAAAAPLPRDCRAALVIPAWLDDTTAAPPTELRTHGDFALDTASCGGMAHCSRGPVSLHFSTPVHGGDLQRRLRVTPHVPLTVLGDTAGVQLAWSLDGPFVPRTIYTFTADSALRDVFGQRPVTRTTAFDVGGLPVAVAMAGGSHVVDGAAPTVTVRHVNADTLRVVAYPVPDSLAAQVWSLPYPQPDAWLRIARGAEASGSRDAEPLTEVLVPVQGALDEETVTRVPLPTRLWMGSRMAIVDVHVHAANAGARPDSLRPAPTSFTRRTALLQRSGLAVHTRVGLAGGAVWVADARTGQPVRNALVQYHDSSGTLRAEARTDATGIATLSAGIAALERERANAVHEFTSPAVRDAIAADDAAGLDEPRTVHPGHLTVTSGDDRALVSLLRADLHVWPAGALRRWQQGGTIDPVFARAAALFTERGIYRPGERVFATVMVREGPLHALTVPPAGDSLRLVLRRRGGMAEGRALTVVRDTIVALSAFGTAADSARLATDAPLGDYDLAAYVGGRHRWSLARRTAFRVAEYRAPEFLVEATADSATRYAGDDAPVTVHARYLFGAPMTRVAARWVAQATPLAGWRVQVDGTDGFVVGETSWRSWHEQQRAPVELARGTDSLGADGTVRIDVPTDSVTGGPMEVRVEATVEDLSRQAVSDGASFVVHPAAVYVAARFAGREWTGTRGTAERLEVLVVSPGGERRENLAVAGIVTRRRHVRVPVEGMPHAWAGSTVTDTVARCDVRSAAEPVGCAWTPTDGGEHEVVLTARDERGRTARTTLTRWVRGSDTDGVSVDPRRLQLRRDRAPYAPGDTARIALVSPFADADAWVVVAREGLLRQWRVRVPRGETTLDVPLEARDAPYVFAHVTLVARTSTANDTAAAAAPVRVGDVELPVSADARRLAVEIVPHAAETMPGDSARVTVRVRDAQGRPATAEVTLWAVDEGVLALTAHPAPDPLGELLAPRFGGLRFTSSERARQPGPPPAIDYHAIARDASPAIRLRGVAGGTAMPQASPAPPAMFEIDHTGQPGADDEPSVRADFRTTAFYAGRLETDASGRAVTVARVPDGLTTYRLVAVAVTREAQAGVDTASLVVTRPLAARPTLPRFVRPGDRFTAGVVVNRRDGQADTARVHAVATGALARDDGATQAVTLGAGQGAEARFAFHVPTTAATHDSARAVARFTATATAGGDAVEATLPVRPAHHPRTHTIAAITGGDANDAALRFRLPPGTSAERSRLVLDVGPTTLDALHGAVRALRLHRYDHSEAVASTGRALAALAAAQRAAGEPVPPADLAAIERAVATLARRQQPGGSVGYWSHDGWTTVWLSMHAGLFLVEARALGVPVDSAMLARLAGYATLTTRAPLPPAQHWLEDSTARVRRWLSGRLAAADFLRRYGQPATFTEDALVDRAHELPWDDRLRLAAVIAGRAELRPRAQALLDAAWGSARAPGRRVVLADSVMTGGAWSFPSRLRPYARLLAATLALEPDHPQLGALAASALTQAQAESRDAWNSMDYGTAIPALAAVGARQRAAAASGVRLEAGNRTVLALAPDGATTRELPLRGLLAADGTLQLRLVADGGAPVYAWATVHEVPEAPPVTPDVTGLVVERWTERLDGTVVTRARAGELLRVRLRVTVPEDRQFVVLEDPLPAGFEVVDLRLGTSGTLGPYLPAGAAGDPRTGDASASWRGALAGRWEDGWWSPWEHRELRDDRVRYATRLLWRGRYDVSYVARATTTGTFVRPPAHAEELYDPALHGRSEGGGWEVVP